MDAYFFITTDDNYCLAIDYNIREKIESNKVKNCKYKSKVHMQYY